MQPISHSFGNYNQSILFPNHKMIQSSSHREWISVLNHVSIYYQLSSIAVIEVPAISLNLDPLSPHFQPRSISSGLQNLPAKIINWSPSFLIFVPYTKMEIAVFQELFS